MSFHSPHLKSRTGKQLINFLLLVVSQKERKTFPVFHRLKKRFFNWLADDGLIAKSPAVKLKPPPLPPAPPKAISNQDKNRMINYSQRNNPRNYAMICFLIDTGCRVSGIARLLVPDIDLDSGRAIVREKGRGGHGRERKVYFLEKTAESIRDYLLIRPDVYFPNLFLSNRGSPLTESGIYQAIKSTGNKSAVTVH